MNSATTAANRRLHDIRRHISPAKLAKDDPVLVLPTGEQVTALTTKDGFVELQVQGRAICRYRATDTTLALELAAVRTPFEGQTTHIPRANVVELFAPVTTTDIPIADVWVVIYVLFITNKDSEHIPIRLSSISNGEDVVFYLLTTGLGRLYQGSKALEEMKGVIFLSRAAFWQGAGTTSFHSRGWLRSPRPSFPSVPSFTRNDLVIAAHPLRPPKPRQGQLLYSRYSVPHGETLEFTAFDLEAPGDQPGVSPHLAAFHRWHNDERVNSAWGEEGTLEKHKEYIKTLLADPGVLPLIMSWDGELMGYVELVWLKENHVAQHFPEEVPCGNWDRGIHVLVGEERFLGNGRSEVWLRSLAHYSFLDEPRTLRVVGEPKASNVAINKAGIAAGYALNTTIDFPYKRSSLLVNARERFFSMCRLH